MLCVKYTRGSPHSDEPATLFQCRDLVLQAKNSEIERFKLEVEGLLASARRLQQQSSSSSAT